ncbi:hypothetical protein CLOM_g10618 [Closterium sp. NIES-68]|nr:hypothetical protein CLOM_g10618 [Closterium sp. NIES-68]
MKSNFPLPSPLSPVSPHLSDRLQSPGVYSSARRARRGELSITRAAQPTRVPVEGEREGGRWREEGKGELS